MSFDNDFDNDVENEGQDAPPRRGRGRSFEGGGERRGGGRSSGGGGGGDRRGGGGSDRNGGGRRGAGGRRRRSAYCPEGKCFDYKDVDHLRRFLNETGKIKPRRQTGNCSRCQRELAREIKRARHLALLPFVESGD